jgi:hypothetical protein
MVALPPRWTASMLNALWLRFKLASDGNGVFASRRPMDT